MEWAIGYVLKTYAKGRNIVVLGEGYRALKCLAFLKSVTPISRMIGEPCDDLDVLKEYLIICEDMYCSHEEWLNQYGFLEIRDYYDWTKYARTNGHLPIDVEYRGAKIGYGSYFPHSKEFIKHIGKIGRFCSIADSVIIQWNHSMNRITTSSLYPILSQKARKVVDETPTDKDPYLTGGKVQIGNDVWIGANVFINASKCTQIGDGAIIGTGSIVLEDVPPYAVIYGAPARVKRYRFSEEEIAVLLKTKWWDWDKKKMEDNIRLLMNPDEFFLRFKGGE